MVSLPTVIHGSTRASFAGGLLFLLARMRFRLGSPGSYARSLAHARMLTLRILLLFVLSVGAGAETRAASDGKVVIVEKGGTGSYSAIVTEDATLPGITIFRPADLTPFSAERKLPILLWGNGACANTTYEHKNFLNEIASHGYVILAIGLLEEIHERGEKSKQPTSSKQMIAAL